MYARYCLSSVISTLLLAVSILPWERVDGSVVWIPQFVSRKQAPSYYLGRRSEAENDKRGWGLPSFSSIPDAANDAFNSASGAVGNIPGDLNNAKTSITNFGNNALDKGKGLVQKKFSFAKTESSTGPYYVSQAERFNAEHGIPNDDAQIKALQRYLEEHELSLDAKKRGWGFSSLTNAANSAINSANDLVDKAPTSFDDVSSMATDLGNSALEKGSQLAAENGLPMSAAELEALARENGVPVSVEEAQLLAAENGLPSNLAELQTLAAENGVPMDTAQLQALAASQGVPMDMATLEQLAAQNGVDISQYQDLAGMAQNIPLEELAGAAGQIAGGLQGGASNSEGALVSIEILDKLSEVKTLANLIKNRCGVAPSTEFGDHESSAITDLEAQKRGSLVRAFAGKRGGLVRAFAGKRGSLVRIFAGKRADDSSMSSLVGLGAQLAPLALNPLGTLSGGGGGAASTGNLYAILAELNEVIIELKELA